MLESVYRPLPRQVESMDDSGTVFPPSPIGGMRYWHTGDDAEYRYSEQAQAWICIT